jgi:hypothetical protein
MYEPATPRFRGGALADDSPLALPENSAIASELPFALTSPLVQSVAVGLQTALPVTLVSCPDSQLEIPQTATEL